MKRGIRYRIIDRCTAIIFRSKLKTKTFSIVCNNCLGGAFYHKFGLKYATPTVALIIFSDDYIKFLENFCFYIKQPLNFIKKSCHPEANNSEWRRSHNVFEDYPLGLLGDIEIHFLHYKNEAEAIEKWNRRKKRMNFNNLFFVMTDDSCDKKIVERFNNLPYKKKILFTVKSQEKELFNWINSWNENLA